MPRLPDEYTKVELPLIEQLKMMNWQHIEGDIDVPYLTERENFRQVLLTERLKAAIHRINRDQDSKPRLDESRIKQAINNLERLQTVKLLEANKLATDLLLKGTQVEGDQSTSRDREQTVKFIDFENPENNDFLVINQFRVDSPRTVGDKDFIVPDIVLFVNGIPLVVIECKSPSATDPVEEGITQLLRYSNRRDWFDADEGAERLFYYNQFTVSTSFYEARIGSITADYDHFTEWKDTAPIPREEIAQQLGVDRLESQHTLVAGMLHKERLLDIVRNFILFQENKNQTIKIVTRYQQYRAVQEAIYRLQHGQTRLRNGEQDQRGGIIWHTQGSGKSVTMVFLVRKMRTLPELRRFKVVMVTDRQDLERQLSETAELTGESVRKARSTSKLKSILQEEGPDLIFAMIQKYQEREAMDELKVEYPQMSESEYRYAAEELADYNEKETKIFKLKREDFPVLNESEDILVMVDEAHRSHNSMLHANLMRALPNCAKIGFTGTPIILDAKRRTQEIFGDFIDKYTIKQSEIDGSTVPIIYEGRTSEGIVRNGESLDQLFEDMFKDRTEEEIEAIKRKYATEGNVLEATKLIEAKSWDMLQHYIKTILPNGLKAQVVATSRLAAVRYYHAFKKHIDELISRSESIDPALPILDEEEILKLDRETQFLIRAHPFLNTIKRLEFAVVISPGSNDDPTWREWTEKNKQETNIDRFKKDLTNDDPEKEDGLAFLCVKSMLLTGFDAPVEQVLYLDRSMQGHELLQAIARVNRPYKGKKCGYVVDYYGVARHLKEALAVYSQEDIEGAMRSIKDELPILDDRHRRVMAVFTERGIDDIGNQIDECVHLLKDLKVRAEFTVKFKRFLESVDIIMPRPEVIPYARDAKLLGFINKAAANLYRDSQLNVMGAGRKVRQLIDNYIMSKGIDPKIPPISILDAEFEEKIEEHTSPRTKASEMEHAIRHHISKSFQEDPAYYKKLSERLEEILDRFQENWEELVKALRNLTREVREGRPADETGLDPKTQAPFMGILAQETHKDGPLTEDDLMKLAEITVPLVDRISEEIKLVDFWRNLYEQNRLRAWIVDYLDEHDIIPFEKQQAVADHLMDLAKALHTRLTAS